MSAPAPRPGKKARKFSSLVSDALPPDPENPPEPDDAAAASLDRRRSELAGGNPANCISQSKVEQVDAKRNSSASIHAFKAHLEKDLRFGGGHIHVQQVHHFPRGRCNLQPRAPNWSDP